MPLGKKQCGVKRRKPADELEHGDGNAERAKRRKGDFPFKSDEQGVAVDRSSSGREYHHKLDPAYHYPQVVAVWDQPFSASRRIPWGRTVSPVCISGDNRRESFGLGLSQYPGFFDPELLDIDGDRAITTTPRRRPLHRIAEVRADQFTYALFQTPGDQVARARERRQRMAKLRDLDTVRLKLKLPGPEDGIIQTDMMQLPVTPLKDKNPRQSMRTVHGISANEAAELDADTHSDDVKEWCHLAAHRHGGKDEQSVCGSYAHNTNDEVVDQAAEACREANVHFSVQAKVVPGTRIAISETKRYHTFGSDGKENKIEVELKDAQTPIALTHQSRAMLQRMFSSVLTPPQAPQRKRAQAKLPRQALMMRA